MFSGIFLFRSFCCIISVISISTANVWPFMQNTLNKNSTVTNSWNYSQSDQFVECICHIRTKCVLSVWLFGTPWTVASLLCTWNCSGKNTGVGCHFLPQGIFLTQRSNLSFLHILHWQADFFIICAAQEALIAVFMCIWFLSWPHLSPAHEIIDLQPGKSENPSRCQDPGCRPLHW